MIDTTIFQDKVAVYYTLGCKLNFAETSSIGKTLKEAGVRTARKGEKADICVINTCSVTEWQIKNVGKPFIVFLVSILMHLLW